MSRSNDLGPSKEIRLPQGVVRYRERGTGRPVVFLHGLLVNGDLWRQVVPAVAADHRCITPDLPLGSHEVPVDRDADLSVPGLARLIADFLEALQLRDAVLVANDTGGALAQVVVTEHPERIGALVLTPCDAFDAFPPAIFRPLLWLARVPFLLRAFTRPLAVPALRRLPFAYGWLSKRPIERRYMDGFLEPFFANPAVFRDCVKVLRGIAPAHTLRAAQQLARFDRPALIAWAAEDRLFPPAHARRLAAILPHARLEMIEDSYTFVSEDQPERLARLIGRFLAEPAAVATATPDQSSRATS